MAGFQHQTPAWEGALPSIPSGPDPALGIYFLPLVTRFIEVASEVGFDSFISLLSAPPPVLFLSLAAL